MISIIKSSNRYCFDGGYDELESYGCDDNFDWEDEIYNVYCKDPFYYGEIFGVSNEEIIGDLNTYEEIYENINEFIEEFQGYRNSSNIISPVDCSDIPF